jgi:hypothetical protein
LRPKAKELRRSELEAPYHSYRQLFTGLVQPFGIGIVMSVPSPYYSYQQLFTGFVQPFGIGVVMSAPSPSSVGFRLSWVAGRTPGRSATMGERQQMEGYARPDMHEHVLDIWDLVVKDIRSSDPGYQPAQDANTTLRWDAATTEQFADSEVDKRIRSDVDARYEEHKA